MVANLCLLNDCVESTLFPNGSLFRDPFWHFGSLFIFEGPYFQCFGLIHAKNVNLVCMYTTMSYLDLTVMSNDLHCYYMYIRVFLKGHFEKNKMFTPPHNWGVPGKIISRRRG